MIRTIEWCGDSVRFLDQTLLPSTEHHIRTDEISILADAIVSLKVRGAPLIGIAAAYGMLLGTRRHKGSSIEIFLEHFHRSFDLLAKTRPTAKNLFWALERMGDVVRLNPTKNSSLLFDMLEQEAVRIHDDDRRMCDAIGFYGAQLIEDGSTILTHCNTGALATGGIGTALGVVKTAFSSGKRLSVMVDETRPLFQGSRLTMWELQRENIPATLITDNTAAWVMKTRNIDMVIVGADRIAANGDTANKIGTLNLALVARSYAIPLYVAAPTTTIDLALSSGDVIPIEERSDKDVLGGFVNPVAPSGAAVFAPAFDVTPNELITAIITEKGVHRPPFQNSFREAGIR